MGPPPARTDANHTKDRTVLSRALPFLIIAILAGILGFTGIAGAATGIARILFFLFPIVFVIALVTGRRMTNPRP